jgi:hypothetical protein
MFAWADSLTAGKGLLRCSARLQTRQVWGRLPVVASGDYAAKLGNHRRAPLRATQLA